MPLDTLYALQPYYLRAMKTGRNEDWLFPGLFSFVSQLEYGMDEHSQQEEGIPVSSDPELDDSAASLDDNDDIGTWRCACGAEFLEPLQLSQHTKDGKRRKEPNHKSIGYILYDDGQILMKFGGYLFTMSEPWRQRRERILAGGPASSADAQADGSQPTGRGRGAYVEIQARPIIYRIDQSLIYIYNLVMQSVASMGVPYAPPFSDWLRDTVVQFYVEHPEILDLKSMFTPEEQDYIMNGGPNGIAENTDAEEVGIPV